MKFFGEVGYGNTEESPVGSGVWKSVITERKYYGDVEQNMRRLEEDGDLNKELSVSNSISVVADAYAYEHFFAIKYVKWSGVLWTVNSVTVRAPRLLLRLGEVYNGPRAPETP